VHARNRNLDHNRNFARMGMDRVDTAKETVETVRVGMGTRYNNLRMVQVAVEVEFARVQQRFQRNL
jgi:hypothetical protein